MCVYERHGPNEIPDYGQKIACCNIRSFWVIRSFDDMAEWQRTKADEPDVEIMTVEQYEKTFGEKFDPKEFEPVDPKEYEPVDPNKPDDKTKPKKDCYKDRSGNKICP